MYYFDTEKKFVEERPVMNSRQKWVVCLSILSLCVCTTTLLFIAYRNHLFGLGLHCPKKSMYFKTDNPSMEKLLWDYATYWSNKAKNEKNFVIFLDTAGPDDDPDVVLNGLRETFQPLSLRPCPVPCRKKLAKKSYRQSRRNKVTAPPIFNHGFGGLPLKPLFEVDLGSEFQFREDVRSEADENLMEIMEKMANETFDQLITIYLSTLTPALETMLSGNGTSNIRDLQTAMLLSAMDGYRNASKPLFLVLGNQSEAIGLDGPDVLKQPDVPENVALAILSSSNDTIFNHGLWPAFGALLAKSNVTSFAMDKTLLNAAQNASLNWTASVTY